MSSNEPCRFIDAETGIPRGGRQILFTGDVFSNAYLGATALGRERDAYRVEDIADHMLAVVEAHGMPLAWRLERGVWESTFTDGIDVSELTGKTDQMWGDLDALFAILRTWKSRGKGAIESSFNLLQNLIAHASTSVGRYRGEFEQGTKLWLAAARATALAGKHGTAESIAAAAKAWEPFWEMAAMGDAYAQACELFNARPKKRRAHGRETVVPADQFREVIRRELPSSELWRFCPVKRRATVRQGAIEMNVNHYPMPFRFRVNGATELYLEHSFNVLVAFHPGKPEAGCHVFNAELGMRNRDGFKFGELLLVAPMAEDAPQFSLTRGEQDAFAMRRRAAAAVRSEFRAIMPAGRQAVRISTARDGRGNSTVAETGVRRAAPADPRVDTSSASRGDVIMQNALAAHRAQALDYEAEAARLNAEDTARLANALPL